MAKVSELYDHDFFLWTKEQAAALRRAKESNLPLDWENLAEEIESLGKSDRRELSIANQAHYCGICSSSKLSPARSRAPDGARRSSMLGQKSRMCCATAPAFAARSMTFIAELKPIWLQHWRLQRSCPTRRTRRCVWARLGKGGFTAEQVLGDWFPETPS